MGKSLWIFWVIAIWSSLIVNAFMRTIVFGNTTPDDLMMAFVIPLFFPLILILLPKLLFIFFRWFFGQSKTVKRAKAVTKSTSIKVANSASTFVQKTTQSKEAKILNIDDEIFEISNDEIENNNQKKGLWAKAFAISEGDERKQKAVYLRLRVEQLKEKTDISEKDFTKSQSVNVDEELDLIRADNIRKSKHSEPESRKSEEPDRPSDIEYVKLHRAEIEADLARWRKEREQRQAIQPQPLPEPLPEPQKTYEPAPINYTSDEQKRIAANLFWGILIISVIVAIVAIVAAFVAGTNEPTSAESSVRIEEFQQASDGDESPYRKAVEFQTAQCEAGEANACRILANAYKEGQMDLVRDLDLSLKYEAMALIETRQEPNAENTFKSSLGIASDVYTVEGFLSAEFGGQPFLVGDLGSGRGRVKSYQYYDEENIIVYSLGFGEERQYLPQSEIPSHLKLSAEAEPELNSAVVSDYRTEVIGNQMVAFYKLHYFINDVYWTKVKMVIIVHGRRIQWAVQTADEYSLVQAATIFDQGYLKLRICGQSLFNGEIPVCDPK